MKTVVLLFFILSMPTPPGLALVTQSSLCVGVVFNLIFSIFHFKFVDLQRSLYRTYSPRDETSVYPSNYTLCRQVGVFSDNRSVFECLTTERYRLNSMSEIFFPNEKAFIWLTNNFFNVCIWFRLCERRIRKLNNKMWVGQMWIIQCFFWPWLSGCSWAFKLLSENRVKTKASMG